MSTATTLFAFDFSADVFDATGDDFSRIGTLLVELSVGVAGFTVSGDAKVGEKYVTADFGSFATTDFEPDRGFLRSHSANGSFCWP